MQNLANNPACVNRISLDWLSFTTQDPSFVRNPELVGAFLGLAGEKKPAGGLFGYKASYYFGLVRVLYAGAENMGVHVIYSGEALRFHAPQPFDLIKRLHLSGQVRFARVDIAYDDFTGSLNIPRLVEYLRQGNVVSSSRRWSCLEDGTIGNDVSETVGEGVMIGKRDSESCLRFYNKTLQQKTLESTEKSEIPENWVRMELELKRDKANEFISKWVEDYGQLDQLFLDVVHGLVRFVEPSETDMDKRRWCLALWWSALVTSQFPVKLSSPAVLPCIVKTVKWFKKSCASSLVLLLNVCGKEFFEGLLTCHQYDFSPDQIKLMKQVYNAHRDEKLISSMEVGF